MAAGGQIVEISPNFAEGGVVEQGEILIRLDDADAQSALLRTESDLSDAKLEIVEAERAIALAKDELAAAVEQEALRSAALLRQQDLQQRGVGTTASVEAAELALSSAKQSVLSRRSGLDQSNARFNQAKTRLARAELANNDALRHLNDTVMRAEFAGVLSGVSLVQGGLISANERVGQLIDPSALEVAFRVSTQQYARLLNEDGTLIAAPADVSLDAIGGSVTSKAVLSRDSGSVADGQTGRVLFARLDNAIGLKPGDFVSVKVEEPALRFVVELPATALNAQNEVLAVGEGDRLETINVTLMRRQGNNVLVRSAIARAGYCHAANATVGQRYQGQSPARGWFDGTRGAQNGQIDQGKTRRTDQAGRGQSMDPCKTQRAFVKTTAQRRNQSGNIETT